MARETDWIRREITFRGRVQGVGFRHATWTVARHYDLTGFVRNLPDGRVRVVAEGDTAEIDRFFEELMTRMAYHIQAAEADNRAPTGQYAGFEIQY